MDDPHADRAGSTPPAPRRWLRRRWLLFGAAVIVVLTVLLAFLPTLLSLGPGRRLLLGMVNRHLTGTLHVDSWSLSWFSGFDLSGVEVRDSGGTPVFAAKEVHVPASVRMLLRSPVDLGTVSIESPQVELVRGADGVWNAMKVIAAKGGPLPLDVKAEVKGRDGRLSVRTADGPVATAAELTADVRIQSLNEPIEYSLAGVLGASQAAFRGHGSAKLTEGLEFSPDALSASLNLSLEGFGLAEIAATARQMGVLPVDVEGSLSATLEAKLEGRRSASAAGHLEVVGLALSGGPLGPDRPAFDKVALDWRIAFDGRSLTVDQLDLSSPVGDAHVTGALPLGGIASLTEARLTADAKLDAAALAERVPHLLRMRSGLALEGGTFEVSATLAPVEGGIALAAHGRLSGLSALLGGRRVEMSAPLGFEANGALSDAGPRIDSLKFSSSFATAEGKGTLADFGLKASADLTALSAELGKFVDLGPLRLAGAVDAQLGMSETGPGGGTERQLAASVALAGLRLEGLTPGPIAVDRLSGEAGGVVSLGTADRGPQATALHGSVKGDLGECEFKAARIGLGSGPVPVEVSGLELSASAPLGRLVALCRAAGLLAGDSSVAGDAVVSLKGGLAGGILNVDDLRATFSQFAFKGSGGLAFAEERVDVTGKGRVSLPEHAVQVESFHVGTASGLLGLDGDGTLADFRFNASADLNALSAELGKFIDMGTLRLAGAVDAQLGMSETGPEGGAERQLAASVVLNGLRLEGLTSGPIALERLSGEAGGVVSLGNRPQVTALHGSVKGDLGECEFKAARVGLGSGPVPVEVSGLELLASAPLGRLVALCRAAGLLGGDSSVAGDAVVSLKGGLAGAILNVDDLRATFSQFELKGSGGLAFAEERIDVAGKGRVNLPDRAVGVEHVRIVPASGLFELDARGSLSDWTGARQLKMQGSLTPELALVGGLLKERVGMDLGLGGKQPWPFDVTTALGKGDWRDALRGTSVEAVLAVERFNCLGLAGTGLTAKVHTADGALAMDIAGTANDGQVALHPVLRTAPDPALLTLAAGENRALVGAQITNEMANALLARVIPVFRRPVSVQGRVTADLSDLRVPLGKDLVQRAAMTMKVQFEGVSLKPAGFLSELLGLVGLRDKAVAVPDQTLGVSLQDGRFRQEQMTLDVAGHALRLSGSVGLDKTLDLLVELPFTRQVVPSDDLYKLLQGQTLKVRVGGTVDAPQFDRNAVRENIRSLTQQAPVELLKRLLK